MQEIRRWMEDEPLVELVLEVAKGAVASAMVYALFSLGEWAVHLVTQSSPHVDNEPAEFVRLTLSWCGAGVAVATWVAVSTFQVLRLTRRLYRRLSDASQV